MLTSRIIPCLDIKGGRVVKGTKFQNLKDSGCPVLAAKRYMEQGADELVILDISATLEDRETTVPLIRKIRKILNIPLTVGGGVRSIQDARRLLEAGADKVAINSAAVLDPNLITRLSRAFGQQCTVVAIDAIVRQKNTWEVLTRSGTHASSIQVMNWMQDVERLGAGEVLLTSWDRDGMREGYDLPLLQAACQTVDIPIIASGGANSATHMLQALSVGVSAVLAASIFHEGDTTVNQIKQYLQQEGVSVRTC